MFYQGDLQSGIALAMREAKAVVCFVRDNQEESTRWEDDYFDNDELRELLSNYAVALRLVAGTRETGFLISICPVQSYPTLIVIRNGVVQEYIFSGTMKDEFQTRLKTVLAASPNPNTAPIAPTPPPAAAQQGNSQTIGTTATTDHDLNQTHTPVAQYQNHQATIESTERTNRRNVRDGKQPDKQMTAEEKKAMQEKEDRRALQLKIQREQKEQREERERIRNQIKHDQEARRQRAAEEKGISSTSSSTPKNISAERPEKRQASDYRLQIRLFDGSSVRHNFPPSATIRKDIRPWLETQRSDGSQPYNLKHILTPLPNRTISVSEEERSLEELELGPTASLVMVPVPSYIEAYAPSGVMSGLPGRVISSGYGLVSGVVGGVTGMVGGLLGYGSTPDLQATSTSDSTGNNHTRPTTTRSSQKINIRTLHDQWNDQDRNEFYNGNTLNFEPKKDDDSKEK
ncbi:hypothetical protein UA08_01986 [Talaromyces atroroseus]|uniref:UBX domain-containing protein 2 n=1 Tax=Talaromyces atroroseus TaxID=1441469 RepID=A0A1Q5QC90_TALAT|nr:hypothetical protein UA08_01986 [Talaromyces atroroseus]OKL63438.1 hypothetical protein UA08_01986 [Talaromyces atroroseus]